MTQDSRPNSVEYSSGLLENILPGHQAVFFRSPLPHYSRRGQRKESGAAADIHEHVPFLQAHPTQNFARRKPPEPFRGP